MRVKIHANTSVGNCYIFHILFIYHDHHVHDATRCSTALD